MLYNVYYTDTVSMILYVALLAIMVMSAVIQAKVNSTFRKYNQVLNARGLTGAQAAEMVLRNHGVMNCGVFQTNGHLTDHYDPKANCIRLSESVYHSSSVAAVGIAAHEAGHAVQYALGYGPIKARAAILPVVQFASGAAIPLALIGFLFAWQPLVYIGIILYAAVTLFQVITLPVELNASRRAMKAIAQYGMLDNEEAKGARRVLTVAALTYVAALATSVLQLLRLITMSNRRK